MGIKIINIQADTHNRYDPKEAMSKAAKGKERIYKDRIEKIENATFVPMIFSTKGAKARQTSRAISTIVSKIGNKNKEQKQEVAKKIANDLSFMFLKLKLAWVRGRRRPCTRTDAV